MFFVVFAEANIVQKAGVEQKTGFPDQRDRSLPISEVLPLKPMIVDFDLTVTC